jgi:hypothetical protein
MNKNLTYSPSYAEHVSALILYLFHVFYKLKHVLSEMVGIVPPYRSADIRKMAIGLTLPLLRHYIFRCVANA